MNFSFSFRFRKLTEQNLGVYFFQKNSTKEGEVSIKDFTFSFRFRKLAEHEFKGKFIKWVSDSEDKANMELKVILYYNFTFNFTLKNDLDFGFGPSWTFSDSENDPVLDLKVKYFLRFHIQFHIQKMGRT